METRYRSTNLFFCALLWKRLNWLNTRDPGRNEIIQIVRRQDRAHGGGVCRSGRKAKMQPGSIKEDIPG